MTYRHHKISHLISLHDTLSKAHMMLLFYTFFKDNQHQQEFISKTHPLNNQHMDHTQTQKDHNFFREVGKYTYYLIQYLNKIHVVNSGAD